MAADDGCLKWLADLIAPATEDASTLELGTSIGHLTLRFKDAKRERAFLASREAQLASSVFRCCGLMVIYIVLSIVIILLDTVIRGISLPLWGTSGGSFHHSEASQKLATARNAQIIGVGAICLVLMFVAKSEKMRGLLGPLGLELITVGAILVSILFICGSHPWYLAHIFGMDPSLVVVKLKDDANLLLLLDAFITAIHAALPLRWVVLWPSEVLFVVCYGCLALGIGSPMPMDAVAMNMAMIIILVTTAALGRRSLEFHERASFVRVASEKGLRFQVEHRLDQLARSTDSGSREPREHEDELVSLATSTKTDEMFSGLQGVDGNEASLRLKQIADLGYREHWLIPGSDVTPQPNRIFGSGGFGIVMGATYHGATVALKVPIASNDPGRGHTFTSIAHELRMFRRLRHPNIVLCYGACIVPKTCEILLVLEYVRGTRLGVFIAPPPAAPSTADRLQLVSGVCCALRYLHSQRPSIVHGDIKCSNVLVEQRLTGVSAKLLDFGLSRLITQRNPPIGGTLTWMAPEAVLDASYKPAPSADVFSFGRLLYMIMTGQRPLSDVSESSIRDAAKKGKPQKLIWPKDIPLQRECKEWCEACCHGKPERRPTIQSVQNRIEKYMNSSPSEETGGGRCLEHAVSEARATLHAQKRARNTAPNAPAFGAVDESSWLTESVAADVHRFSEQPPEEGGAAPQEPSQAGSPQEHELGQAAEDDVRTRSL